MTAARSVWIAGRSRIVEGHEIALRYPHCFKPVPGSSTRSTRTGSVGRSAPRRCGPPAQLRRIDQGSLSIGGSRQAHRRARSLNDPSASTSGSPQMRKPIFSRNYARSDPGLETGGPARRPVRQGDRDPHRERRRTRRTPRTKRVRLQFVIQRSVARRIRRSWDRAMRRMASPPKLRRRTIPIRSGGLASDAPSSESAPLRRCDRGKAPIRLASRAVDRRPRLRPIKYLQPRPQPASHMKEAAHGPGGIGPWTAGCVLSL